MSNVENRQHDYNFSYLDGRAVELFVDRWFIKNGYITSSTRGSKNSYDLKIIDPSADINDSEYLVQIKSSKKITPYITCKHMQWLMDDARQMKCRTLVGFCHTYYKKFYVFDPITRQVLFTNDKKWLNKKLLDFKCLNKDR